MTEQIPGQMTIFDLDSRCGKTCPEHSPATKERTSGQSCKPSPKSKPQEFLFLNLRGTGDLLGASWETAGALPGVSMMLNTGECPSDARESTLSQILQATAPEKYYLSARVSKGIIARAKKYGKELPKMLLEALEETASYASRNEPESLEAVGTVYAIDATSSNSMKSRNPHSGFHEETYFKCLDTSGGNPNCNQGGNVIVQKVFRKANKPHSAHEAPRFEQDEISNCLNAFDIGKTRASEYVVQPARPPRKYIVRRLTPLECCRLQGFPDWWEDGAEGSDSARYKMWGNGIALPCAADVLRRVAKAMREA